MQRDIFTVFQIAIWSTTNILRNFQVTDSKLNNNGQILAHFEEHKERSGVWLSLLMACLAYKSFPFLSNRLNKIFWWLKSRVLTKRNKCKYITITERAKRHDLWPKHNQMRFTVGVKHVVILNLFERTSIQNVLGESCVKVISVKNSTMCKNYKTR